MDNMQEKRFEIDKFYADLSKSWDETRPKYTNDIM